MTSTKYLKYQQQKDTLLYQLGLFLDKEQIITEASRLIPYECDGLAAYKKRPLAVILPNTIEDIQQIMRSCNQLSIPVVARGAGTGLSGGALPHEGGIILALSKMNKIIDINPINNTARIQPGVRNLAISEAAKPHNLYYAPDPSSQIACSIGGNVAENAGGVHCLKYGLTVHNILELKVVTIDGDLLTIGSEALDNPGINLIPLITGSEGLLGIVVEIVVNLRPIPEKKKVIMASFDSLTKAGKSIIAIIRSGIIPAGLEMMDQLAIEAAEDFAHAGYPKDATAILLCELDGTDEDIQEQSKQIIQLFQSSKATQIVEADSLQEQNKLWAGRKSAFPAIGRISADYYCMDGTIPRKHIAEVLKQIDLLSQQYGLRVANVFHAGDGNLHPLILFDTSIEGELDKAEMLGADILYLCVQYGGTITGEHGVGHEKIDQMCDQFSFDELAYFHTIKDAFDPKGLLNPEKAVPTLHRCAELGFMHVHNGQLSHPELPRF